MRSASASSKVEYGKVVLAGAKSIVDDQKEPQAFRFADCPI